MEKDFIFTLVGGVRQPFDESNCLYLDVRFPCFMKVDFIVIKIDTTKENQCHLHREMGQTYTMVS
jgi:hypothetical protein